MKKYREVVSNWMHELTEGCMAIACDDFVAMNEEMSVRNLRFSGTLKHNIAFACNAFYKQKKLSSLPPDLMYMACHHLDQNSVVIDSQGVFSFNRFDVSNETDDGGVYKELPTGYEMFDIEETLVLIAEIVMLWVSSKHRAQTSTLHSLRSVLECGFFMVDEAEAPWTIRLINNNGQPIVTMHEFNETDDMWPKKATVLSPLSTADENYTHSLES